jgi:hypothetical protein
MASGCDYLVVEDRMFSGVWTIWDSVDVRQAEKLARVKLLPRNTLFFHEIDCARSAPQYNRGTSG